MSQNEGKNDFKINKNVGMKRMISEWMCHNPVAIFLRNRLRKAIVFDSLWIL
jgi:hypothetical protein